MNGLPAKFKKLHGCTSGHSRPPIANRDPSLTAHPWDFPVLPEDTWENIFDLLLGCRDDTLHGAVFGGHQTLLERWGQVRMCGGACHSLSSVARCFEEKSCDRLKRTRQMPELGAPLAFTTALGPAGINCEVHWGLICSCERTSAYIKRVAAAANPRPLLQEWLSDLHWREDAPGDIEDAKHYHWREEHLKEWCLFLDLGGAELIAELLDFDLDSDETPNAPGWQDLAYLERVCAVHRCCVSPDTVWFQFIRISSVCVPQRYASFQLFWIREGDFRLRGAQVPMNDDELWHASFYDDQDAFMHWLNALCASDVAAAERVLRRVLLGDLDAVWSWNGHSTLYARWACLCEACGRESNADNLLAASCSTRHKLEEHLLTHRLWVTYRTMLETNETSDQFQATPYAAYNGSQEQLALLLPEPTPEKDCGALMRCLGFPEKGKNCRAGPSTEHGRELVARFDPWYADHREVGQHHKECSASQRDYFRRLDGSKMDCTTSTTKYSNWMGNEVEEEHPSSLKSMDTWWGEVIVYRYHLESAVKPRDIYRNAQHGPGRKRVNKSKHMLYKLVREAPLNSDDLAVATVYEWVRPSYLHSLLHQMNIQHDVCHHRIVVLKYPRLSPRRPKRRRQRIWKGGVVTDCARHATTGQQTRMSLVATIKYNDGTSGQLDLLSPKNTWKLDECENASWIHKQSVSGQEVDYDHLPGKCNWETMTGQACYRRNMLSDDPRCEYYSWSSDLGTPGWVHPWQSTRYKRSQPQLSEN